MDTSILKQAINFMLEVVGMVLLFYAVINLFSNEFFKLDQASSVFFLVLFVVGSIAKYYRLKLDQKKKHAL